MINMYTRDVGCRYAIVLVINACLSQSFNTGVILSPLFITTGDEVKMAKHDTVGPFSGDSEDWSKRLDQYFITNDVTSGEKKKAIFVSICGTQTYKLI